MFSLKKRDVCRECEECTDLVLNEAAMWHTENLEDLISGVIMFFLTDIDECETKCNKCASSGKTSEQRNFGHTLRDAMTVLKGKTSVLHDNVKDLEAWREHPVDQEFVDSLASRMTKHKRQDDSSKRVIDQAEATFRTAESVKNAELNSRRLAWARQKVEDDLQDTTSKRQDLLDPKLFTVLSEWHTYANPYAELIKAYREVTGKELNANLGASLVQRYVRR